MGEFPFEAAHFEHVSTRLSKQRVLLGGLVGLEKVRQGVLNCTVCEGNSWPWLAASGPIHQLHILLCAEEVGSASRVPIFPVVF